MNGEAPDGERGRPHRDPAYPYGSAADESAGDAAIGDPPGSPGWSSTDSWSPSGSWSPGNSWSSDDPAPADPAPGSWISAPSWPTEPDEADPTRPNGSAWQHADDQYGDHGPGRDRYGAEAGPHREDSHRAGEDSDPYRAGEDSDPYRAEAGPSAGPIWAQVMWESTDPWPSGETATLPAILDQPATRDDPAWRTAPESEPDRLPARREPPGAVGPLPRWGRASVDLRHGASAWIDRLRRTLTSRRPAPPMTDEDADGPDDPEGAAQQGHPGRHTMPLWQELPLLLLVAFCLAVLIRTFLLQAFFIPSGSMEQTLLVGDRVLVNKIVYDVRQPERGEVIVFRGTDNWASENPPAAGGGLFSRIGHTLGDLVGISRPGEKDFIKRVIGLPGDRVSCCDPNGRVYVNGTPIDEPYVINNSPLDAQPDAHVCRSRRFEEVLVPPGQLFVMGDHRIVSQDSRCEGTVPIENVIGRAFIIVWPSSRWASLGVPDTFTHVPGPVAAGRPDAGQPQWTLAAPGPRWTLAARGPRWTLAAREPRWTPTAEPAHRVPGVALAIAMPILAPLVVSARTLRKRLWGRRTLRR
jgi:signal peptidase I